MKNQKTLYLLLPVVLAIWGFIGYRIFGAMGDQETTNAPILVPINVGPDEDSVAQYQPNLDYPDPFLKGLRLSSRRNTNPASSSQIQAPPKPTPPEVQAAPEPTPPAPWPVQYQGWVKEGDGITKVALLSLNGQFGSLRPGQSRNGYTLVEVRADSAALKRGEETRWFRKGG